MSEPTAEQRRHLNTQIKRAQALDPELLECRVGGTRHKWVRCQPDFEAHSGQRVTAHQCSNCLTIKRMRFGSKYGEIISRSYEYPPEFMLKRKEGEIGHLLSPAAVRLTLADREGLPELQAIEVDDD